MSPDDEPESEKPTPDETEKPAPAGGAGAGASAVPTVLRNGVSAAIRTTGLTAIVLTVAMALVEGVWWSVGTLIGGVLATLNLLLFSQLASAFIAQKGRSAPWAVLGGVKLLGLFFCVYVILRRGDVAPLAFVIGYGALPIGITLSSLRKQTDDD